MPLVSNGPVFCPRPGEHLGHLLRRPWLEGFRNSGLYGQARRRITQRERGCRGRDPSCRRGEAWGQTRDECFVPCFVAFSNQGTASHFFCKRASLGVALPKRKTAPHFSWKRSSLGVALPKRKTAPHFSWKCSSSDRQLSIGRNPNRDSRFRGNDTVGARRCHTRHAPTSNNAPAGRSTHKKRARQMPGPSQTQCNQTYWKVLPALKVAT